MNSGSSGCNGYWTSYRFWGIGKCGTKRGVRKRGWVGVGSVMQVAVFVALVCGWVYFFCCSAVACVKDFRGLGLCTIGWYSRLVSGW
jgi:hypothetical protein